MDSPSPIGASVAVGESVRVRRASVHRGRRFTAACFLATVFGQALTAAASAEQAETPPRWALSIETIVLQRTPGTDRTLVERVPGTVPFNATFTTPGTEAFNSNQFRQGLIAGPKISLRYNYDAGASIEALYFMTSTGTSSSTTGPDSPADWLVMRAPGAFWQTQDFADQGMTWNEASNLYNAEINERWRLPNRVTVLAGVRWLQLNDKLTGTLSPPDLTQPTWKQTCQTCDIFHITAGTAAGVYPPFWTTTTTNNLYGVQVGIDGNIGEIDRLSLDGFLKVGVFDNNATQSAGVSLQKQVHPASATTNHAAFVGEAGLQLRYRLQKGLTLKVGYEALWLAGVALAPAQIEQTYTSRSGVVSALGVDCGSNVLFQGVTFGLEHSF